MSVRMQLYRTIILILTGSFLALVLDFYRALRSIIKPGQVGTFIGDVCYTIASFVIVGLVLLYTSWGEMRVFYLIFMTLGVLIFRSVFKYRFVIIIRELLRRLFIVLDAVITFVGKVLGALGSVIATPIIIIYKGLLLVGAMLNYLVLKPFELFRKN